MILETNKLLRSSLLLSLYALKTCSTNNNFIIGCFRFPLVIYIHLSLFHHILLFLTFFPKLNNDRWYARLAGVRKGSEKPQGESVLDVTLYHTIAYDIGCLCPLHYFGRILEWISVSPTTNSAFFPHKLWLSTTWIPRIGSFSPVAGVPPFLFRNHHFTGLWCTLMFWHLFCPVICQKFKRYFAFIEKIAIVITLLASFSLLYSPSCIHLFSFLAWQLKLERCLSCLNMKLCLIF